MTRNSARILVRGVNWLGDAVMTTPALLRLRQAAPGAHITLLTHDKLADLWSHHPAVDSLLTFSGGDALRSVAHKLRAGNFQTGLALPNSPRAALELWLAGIPRRIGYAASLRSWFLTDPVPRGPDFVRMRKRPIARIRRLAAVASAGSIPVPRGSPPPAAAHHLHHYLRLVAALGANPQPLPPCVIVTGQEMAEVRQKFHLTREPAWLGLNPGAEYGPAKRWPPERFLAAATEIQKRTRLPWLIFGAPGDSPLAGDLARGLSLAFPNATPLNLAGQTTLRELCALLASCRALLTNDTGPMHLAAAVGTPVVAIFGSTSPEFTAPGLPEDSRHRFLVSDAPCSPCFHRECPIDFRCMHGIDVDRVVRALAEVVAC
jgi:heptosyltransferase-2